MDSDNDLLDTHNTRDDIHKLAEWKLSKTIQERYEDCARQAHAYRNAARLLGDNLQILDWDELNVSSQMNLIADAKNVVANPSITAAELNLLYKKRLIAGGDIDNPDLGISDDNSSICQNIEEIVLEHLKKCLFDPSKS